MTAAAWHGSILHCLPATMESTATAAILGGQLAANQGSQSCHRPIGGFTTCCNLCFTGFQLLADDLGGWGGICHDVLQQLRDQYPSQPVLYFSLQHQQQQQAAAPSSGGLTPAQTRCAVNTAPRWNNAPCHGCVIAIHMLQ
jgi:hypothetical protein